MSESVETRFSSHSPSRVSKPRSGHGSDVDCKSDLGVLSDIEVSCKHGMGCIRNQEANSQDQGRTDGRGITETMIRTMSWDGELRLYKRVSNNYYLVYGVTTPYRGTVQKRSHEVIRGSRVTIMREQ